MKTIQVKDETWQWLSKLKIELMHSDLDTTINYLKYEEDNYNKLFPEGLNEI